MSAIANLVVYDRSAVAHTFVPVLVTREKGKVVALYREQVTGVPVEAQTSVTVSNETLPSGVNKVEIQVATPVMESVSGVNAAGYTAAPKVAHIPRLVLTGYFSGRSSDTNRAQIRQFMSNIVNGQITAYTTIYTGPGPELVDQLISPT